MELAVLFQEARSVLKESSTQNTLGGSASKGKGKAPVRSSRGKTPLSKGPGRAQSSGWGFLLPALIAELVRELRHPERNSPISWEAIQLLPRNAPAVVQMQVMDKQSS